MEKIKIEFELLSLNKVINSSKQHWSGYSTQKRQLTNVIALQTKRLGDMSKYSPINFAFEWHVKDRRMDKDNIAFNKKYVLDGLVKAGVIPNDNWDHVESFVDEFIIDKKWQGVILYFN